MIKTLKTMSKQDKERYTVPRKVQDVIPVRRIWPDGIFLTGNKFSKTYRFSDINYLVASREDKESMFLIYSELLNSLDSGAVTKITINNRRMNKANFEQSILMPMQEDFRDEYRREYNQMLLDKATGANGITQEKYITISVVKKDIEEARAYFATEMVIYFSCIMPLAPVALSSSIWLYSPRYSSRKSPCMGMRMDVSKFALFKRRLLMVIFVTAPESRELSSSE